MTEDSENTTPVVKTANDKILEWVEALRSEQYEQTTEVLHQKMGDNASESAFCCLGVLCHLNQDSLGVSQIEDRVFYNGVDTDLPAEFASDLGIPNKIEHMLIEMNDKYGFTFGRIADVVESLYNQGLIGKHD